jgi:F-type H+-transporting ATPase subunit epsilon
MKIEVLTPKGKEFEGEVETLILPTLAGEISVLPKHCSLISVLKAGRMKIKTKEKEIEKEIEGGIFEIRKDSAFILLKKF